MRKTASTTFIITRLLADGVRLFATAIPLTIIFRFAGAFESWGDMELYLLAITIISLISLIYTFMGGIKAVFWMNVVQLGVYNSCAILAILLLMGQFTISHGESMTVLR